MARSARAQKSQSAIGLLSGLRRALATAPRTRPLYRGLVDLVERAVAQGDVPSGARLPPERDLARTLRLSRTTIVSAYRELEARGLVRGYVGRGTFVCARPDPGSAPFAWRGKVSSAALQSTSTTVRDLVRDAADPRVLSLAAGQPALECFPTAAFQRAVDTTLTRDGRAAWGLGATEGQPRFRAAIAERFGGTPDQILVIVGAQQGLDLLARCLVDPGDAVIIDRPGYLGAIDSFRSAGARLVGWDVGRAEVDELEELLLRYRPKLIYLNPTHQNPTGLTMSVRVREDVLALADRYRVPIVEDDTYRELTLNAPAPPSLFALDTAHNLVIRLCSFSKMLAPGLRLGWITAVPSIVEHLALIKQRVDPHTQNLSQLVVAELIESGVFDRHLGKLRAEHRRRRDAMVRALRAHVPAGRLRFRIPDGGLYLWCHLPPGAPARAVQEAALRESVVFVPGDAFHVDRGGTHDLRLCYTSQPPDVSERAARVLARAIAAAESRPHAGDPVV